MSAYLICNALPKPKKTLKYQYLAICKDIVALYQCRYFKNATKRGTCTQKYPYSWKIKKNKNTLYYEKLFAEVEEHCIQNAYIKEMCKKGSVNILMHCKKL